MKRKLIVLTLCLGGFSSCASLFSGAGYQTSMLEKSGESSKETPRETNNKTKSNSNRNRGNAQQGVRRPRVLSQQSGLPRTFQNNPNLNHNRNNFYNFSALQLTRVGGNIWRTSANPMVVFGIMSRIISQSYIISAVDRKNMNIQTEWDKFFIDGRLFRNRINITVFPVGNRMTEVVIKNAVEYYSGSVEKQEQNMAWLPSPDLTDEVNRLVLNTDKQTAFLYSQQNIR